MRIILIIYCIGLFSCTKKSPLPSRYDSREFGHVSSFKEQAWGTCWSFATMSTIESNLLKNGEWNNSNEQGEVDLSEYHLDKYNGFNRNGRKGDRQSGWYSGQGENFVGSNSDSPNDGLVVHLGGDYQVASAYLLRSGGAVQERLTPPIESSGNYSHFGDTPRTGILFRNNYKYFFPKSIAWLSFDGSIEEKRNKIKKAIIKYGAVASSQNMRDEPLSIAPDGLEIHMNINNKELNHAISLIGWDDDIHYKDHRGAWIVKDSDHKNEETGKHIGVFYIMYDDLHVAKDKMMGGVAFYDTSALVFDDVYTHSLHGWRYTTDKNIDYIKNVFKAKSNGSIRKLGYVSIGHKTITDFEVIINGKSIVKFNALKEETGVYTIDLNQEVLIKKNDLIEIIQRSSSNQFGFEGSFMMKVLLGKLPKWGEPVSVSSKAEAGQAYYRLKNDSKEKDFIKYPNTDWSSDDETKAKVGNSANPTLYLYID